MSNYIFTAENIMTATTADNPATSATEFSETDKASSQNAFISRIFGEPNSLKDSATPLYLQLQSLIQQAIDCGTLERGSALPAEREIAQYMKVSRVTVKRAISELVTEGLLVQRQGAGTFVAERMVHKLDRLNSFSEVIESVAKHPDSLWIERGIGLANREEQTRLELPSGAEVVRMFRVRMADETPVALEYAVVPRRFLDNPFEVTGSLYEALARAGSRPVKAVQKLRAVALEETFADYLNIDAGIPVIVMERRGFLADNTPVEYSRSHFLGDTFEFEAEV
ncbi:GntR family transcriptional regulator [Parendozoicomonas haliclonae]|nr:GntR family transcriptional regulator [Parendozoicomonas haliclonae]